MRGKHVRVGFAVFGTVLWMACGGNPPSASDEVSPPEGWTSAGVDAVGDPGQMTVAPNTPPWTSRDVGAAGLRGSTTLKDGTYTLRGSGQDIWGKSDAFRFMYLPLAGNGSITARVASLAGRHPWTKAGVMIRASPDPSAAHAFMFVSRSKGLAFQRRLERGRATFHTSGGAGVAPQWVRLTRRGDVITASVSTDGVRWREVGSARFPNMPVNALAGIAVTSHDNAVLATATFDHLVIEPSQAPPLTITSPAPGSALRRTARFTWSGPGDEFWLDIGSAPGRADIYSSGSLGQQREHTVNGLPLSGARLYVQLRRRVGGATDSVTAQYTAPIRRGLAVITDFADRSLEDWTGNGINNANDLAEMLRQMEDHWAWLSRGVERIQWDILRVRLSQAITPGDPFNGDWGAFRTAVAERIWEELRRTQVPIENYDVDGNGDIDAAWIIVSNGNLPMASAIGGAALVRGVNNFVDGQASYSVTSGAYGNFNHELGHLVGLPDLYGTYDTVHTLTVMSYSWPVPPPDFTAYERVKLGWLKPQVLTETTRGVSLPPAQDALAAVMIPTARPTEYFLIEHRRTPEGGYGSVGVPRINGLAVYHVLEGRSMNVDPPLLKLEPADGNIRPGDGLNAMDFLYPGNPGMRQPLVLRSYYGGVEIFRIENVAWRNNRLAFDVVIAQAVEPSNLLNNSSFESGQSSRPTAWGTGSYAPTDGFAWPASPAHTGARSAQLEARSANDMWWSQSVEVVAGRTYLLCGWLKGENIASTQGTMGGNVSVLGGFSVSQALSGTFDWTPRCVSFVAAAARIDVACRLGFYGSTASGRLWCDDVTLEDVTLGSAF